MLFPFSLWFFILDLIMDWIWCVFDRRTMITIARDSGGSPVGVRSGSEDWTKDRLHSSTTSDFHFRVEGMLQDICCELLKKGRVQLNPDVSLAASGSKRSWLVVWHLAVEFLFVEVVWYDCVRWHNLLDALACSRWMRGTNGYMFPCPEFLPPS